MEKKGTGAKAAKGSAARPDDKEKKNVEDKLDSFAEKFSHAMSEGVKRMEAAFEKGVQNIKDNPDLAGSRLRGFFTSSTGGAVLILVGGLWFFYAFGLLENRVLPILVIILGFYLMFRYKSG